MFKKRFGVTPNEWRQRNALQKAIALAQGTGNDASLLSNNSISGDTSGQSGFAQGTAANATAQGDQNQDAAKAADSGSSDDTDEQNKKKKPIALAQKVSRVTVLLPAKSN